MNSRIMFGVLCVALPAIGQIAFAHDGKRTEIVVIDNQLYGQGYLFSSDGNPTDDGAGTTRPYQNAIHSHFTALGSRGFTAITGFDLYEPEQLAGHDLVLTLTGAGKWANPPAQNGQGLLQNFGDPILSPLGDNEIIEVTYGAQETTSAEMGSFLLTSDIDDPVTDIDLFPFVEFQPVDTIYFLSWTLSTDAPGILASQPIHTLLSPPGEPMTPERMHFQSLWLEKSLSVQANTVPEPGSFSLFVLAGLTVLTSRRK